jgi:hypothetical protein
MLWVVWTLYGGTHFLLVFAGESKAKPKEPLTAARALRNYQLSQFRVIVENAIMRLKRWRVLGSKFRHWKLTKDPAKSASDTGFCDKIVRMLSALTNWQVHVGDLKPLRQAGWSAKPSDSYMQKLETRAAKERKEDQQRFTVLRDLGEDPFTVDDWSEAHDWSPSDDEEFDEVADAVPQVVDSDSDSDDSGDDEFSGDSSDDEQAMDEDAAAPAQPAVEEYSSRGRRIIRRHLSNQWV